MTEDGKHPNDKILNCQECGNCCRVAGYIEPKMLRPKSRRESKKDFTCRFFHEPNICGIYDTRPDKCRAAKQPKKIIKEQRKICEYLKTTKKPDMEKIFEFFK